MRILGYLSLGLLAYVVFVLVLFPASIVVKRLPLGPVSISGVEGPLWGGTASVVQIPNESLPTGPDMFSIEDISWRLAPLQLLAGAGATTVSFSAYGGEGSGLLSQSVTGTLAVEDFHYSGTGNGLSELLEPLAKIGGSLKLSINSMEVVKQNPQSLDATLQWEKAMLLEPMPASLGLLNISIAPDGERHVADITATGGDFTITGSVDIDKNGDYKSDIVIKPQASAPREVTDMLQRVARRSSDGSYRIRQSGNINRMM